MADSLRSNGSLPPLQDDSSSSSSSSEQQPAPQALVWVLFYLAQHYDRLGRMADALRLVDECIEVCKSRKCFITDW